MARFILEAAGEDITVGGADVNVIGTSADGEVITVVDGNVTLDGSFAAGGDTIELPGEAENYTAILSGSRVIISNGAGISISIPAGTAGIAVDFGGDDVRELRIEGDAVVFGEQTVTADSETSLEPGSDDATIVEALAALAEAQAALDTFETENDTGANLRADLTLAQDDLAAARAIRSDAQLQADLTSANADVEAAETDVEAVAGLAAAIEDAAAAEAAFDVALDAYLDAIADQNGAIAAYETLNPAITVNTLSLALDGTWSGTIEDGGAVLIEVDPVTGLPTLAAGITEATNPGVTELLNASVAADEALAVAIEADIAWDEAEDTVDLLDQVASADDERQDIADFDAAVAAYYSALNAYQGDASASNATALEAAYGDLVATGVVDVVADNNGTAGIQADEIDDQNADVEVEIETQEANLDDLLVAAEASNPLTDALNNALADQELAQDAVAARNDLIQDVAEAQVLVNQVEVLEANVDSAEEAIVDMGYTSPIEVGGAPEAATAGNDVFLFDDQDGEVTAFGAAGNDILFVGAGYTTVELATTADIDNDAVGAAGDLEIFMQQVGSDTYLYIEDETFAGNVADGSFSGSTIVLADVDMADVTFDATGYIAIEDASMA